MGKIVSKTDIKTEPKRSKKTFIIISIALLLLVIFITVFVLNLQLPKADTAAPKLTEENREEIKAQAEDITSFIEIMKNQNVALNLSPDSEFAYPGVPNELNEYPIYKTCDGRVMPNNINPFASYSWALLAYVSMYELQPTEQLKESIRQIENRLYDIYKLQPHYDISTMVMFRQLDYIYEHMKGKHVLADENRLKSLITNDTRIYFELSRYNGGEILPLDVLQVSSMHSTSFSQLYLHAEDYGFNGTEKEKLLVDANAFYKQASDHDKGITAAEICWLKLSEYYLGKAKNNPDREVIQFFGRPLSETILSNDSKIAPVLIQPCIETLIYLYRDTGDKAYLAKAREANSALLDLTNQNDCSGGAKNVLPYNYEEGNPEDKEENSKVYLLSDNAYELYLLSQPELSGVQQ